MRGKAEGNPSLGNSGWCEVVGGESCMGVLGCYSAALFNAAEGGWGGLH